MPSFLCRALAGALAVFLILPCAFAVEAVWIGGPSGNWSEASNWSTGVVPNINSTNTTIDDDLTQDSVAVLDQHVTIGNLAIDPQDTLNIETSRQLTANSVFVEGDVNLAPAGRLTVRELLWIEPTGRLSLSDNPAQTGATVMGIPTNIPLWNQGRIEGAGSVNPFVLNNEGSVIGNLPGEILVMGLDSTGFTNINTGDLVAEDGGILLLFSSSGAILHNTGGVIEARGDSTIILQNAFTGDPLLLTGGSISSTTTGGVNPGVVQLESVSLDDVHLSGNIASRSVALEGPIENDGVITLEANALWVNAPVVLSGSGRIDLRGHSLMGSSSGLDDPLLIHEAGHTIVGHGSMSAKLINRGVIESYADSLDSTMQVSSILVNSGTIRAKSGTTLSAGNSGSPLPVLENSEGQIKGVIEAEVDSTLQLGPTVVRGGVLRSLTPTSEGSSQHGRIVTLGVQSTTLEDIRLEGVIGEQQSSWTLTGVIENTDELQGKILVNQDATLIGGGVVRLHDVAGPAFTGGSNATVFVNQDNLLTGSGTMELAGLAFINRGVIQADTMSIPLLIQTEGFLPSEVTNIGTLRATDGATLEIGTAVNNREGSNQGIIHADDSSTVRVTSVTGGILSTEGNGEIFVGGFCCIPALMLNDVHNLGRISLSGSTRLAGVIRNDGLIGSQLGAQAIFDGPVVQLTGTGSFAQTAPFNLQVGQFNPAIFVHGPDHTIQGHGTISVGNGNMVNYGTVIASGNTPLVLAFSQGTTFQQRGTLVAETSRTMEVQMNDELFVNRGVIQAAGTFQLKRLNPGSVELRNATGAELHFDSTLKVLLPNHSGHMLSLWNQGGALLAGHGTINLFRALANHETLLRNSGIIRPEGASGSLGEILVSGNFQQDLTGVLELELGGAPASGDYDALHVTDGRAFLGGTLVVTLVNEYDPAIGDSFEILTNIGGEVLGAFDTFTAPALSGRWWALNYLSDRVVLSVEQITADFNLDGVVSNDDLIVWQASHGIDASGDADGDGDTDGRDFLEWQRQYGSGVVAAQGLNVPEPGAIALAAVLVVLMNSPATRLRYASVPAGLSGDAWVVG